MGRDDSLPGIALQMSGRLTEAREAGLQVLERGLERLERPAQPDAPWDAPLYLAWAYRLLDEKAKAYCILEKYLTQRTLLKSRSASTIPSLMSLGETLNSIRSWPI